MDEEWEEPHPGVPLSFPSAGTTLPRACHHACVAGEVRNNRGEAKALGSTSLRLARLWLRPTYAKSAHSCCCQASTSVSEPNQGSDTTFLPAISHAHSVDCLPTTALAHRGLESETTAGVDGRSESPSCVTGVGTSSELSLPPLPVAKLPGEHQFAPSAEAEANDENLSFVSLECGRVVVPDQDPYGWEAELNRREGCSIGRLGGVRDEKKRVARLGRWGWGVTPSAEGTPESSQR
jgi:hypothetical protein